MDLIAYLKSKNVWFNLIEKDFTVHTAEAAAKTGIPLERIVKSLVFLVDNVPVVLIIPGNCRVDKKKVKELLNAKNVEIVPFEKAEEYSGYPAGATPPLHYKKIEKVVIDKRVMKFESVFGGGSRKRLLELKPQDIQKLNNAIVADVVE